jgi:hypothetical protein
MEVLLRHRTTKLYFAGNQRWVSKAAEAFRFETIQAAVERLQQEELRRMELLIEGKTILPLANATPAGEPK